MNKSRIESIESYIDSYIYNSIPKDLPRYAYVYHLQMAFTDFAVDHGAIFGPFEKHYSFSLSANTYWAYKKLEEEDNFEFEYDQKLHFIAINNILLGYQYSILCEIFPKLHNGLAELKETSTNHFEIIEQELSREHFIFMHEYSKRNMLSYILQMLCGKNTAMDKEDRAYNLLEHYGSYWSEQLNSSDFKDYSRLEWGGVAIYFTLAALRRYISLYDNDFNIEKYHPSNLVVKLSEKWKDYLPDFLNTSIESTNRILDDFIYKEHGYGYYPKCLITDAPI